MRLVNIDYSKVLREEVSTEFYIDEIKIGVSILPIPETSKCLVSIFQEDEPLIINREVQTNDPIISFNNMDVKFSGEFVFMYINEYSVRDDFDINRLGDDLLLFYIEEEDYES